MLKLIHKNEVNTFHLIDDDLYFLGVDLHCHTPRGTLERLNNSTCSISHLKDFVIFDDAHGSIRIYDRYTDKCLFSHDPHEIKIAIGFRPVLARPNKIHVAIRKGRKKTFGLLDLSDFTLQAVNFDCTFGPLKSGLVLDRTTDDNWKFFLRAVDPISGEEAWRFDDFRKGLTSNIGDLVTEDVHKICGVYDDVLWVLLTGDRVIGLNPDTGKVIRQFTSDNADCSDFLKNNKKVPRYLPLGAAAFLPDEGLMIGINEYGYCEVRLDEPQPTWRAYSVGSSFKDHGFLGIMKIRAHGQFIYFAESMGSRIGAFDRMTRRVIWSDDLKNYNTDAGIAFEIKATDKHLYVQDNKQNLYVFKHETPAGD